VDAAGGCRAFLKVRVRVHRYSQGVMSLVLDPIGMYRFISFCLQVSRMILKCC
jgi:hypothetical protein